MASTEPVRCYSGLITAQVSVALTSTQVFDDARTNAAEGDDGTAPLGSQPEVGFRELKNTDAANPIFFGKDATVTALTGHRVKPGEAFTIAGAGRIYLGPIWAIATGAPVVTTTAEW